ncbi:MAG: hypothetical protein WAL85_08195 [Candidatus Korobacteraceae bacterium]
MSAPQTKVTIDRLVLRGVDPHHAQALAESLKAELARTFAEPGGHQRLLRAQSTPVLRLGRIPLDAGRAGARKFGTNVARAIASGKGVKR